jgi:endonuclease III
MEKIVKIGIEHFKSTEKGNVHFTGDKKVDKLLNDIENNPHVFVLACLMDRQIRAEKAWGIPQKVFDIVGTYKLNKLSKIPLEDYVNIFSENNLHRFNVDMAEIFFSAIQDIKVKYHGNVANIWNDKPKSALVVYRFLQFKGCGVKIATMAANILARQYKIEFSDYYSVDISPDVHVKRVFSRMGLVPPNPSPEVVIYKARELYPKFPGIIDSSCWQIGREWCKPTNPDCGNCIIKDDCEKL